MYMLCENISQWILPASYITSVQNFSQHTSFHTPYTGPSSVSTLLRLFLPPFLCFTSGFSSFSYQLHFLYSLYVYYIPIYLVTAKVTSLSAHYLREEQEYSLYFATNASVPASSLTPNLPHAQTDIFKSRKYFPERRCNCHPGGSVEKLLVTGRRAVA